MFYHKPDRQNEEYLDFVYSGKLISIIINRKVITYEIGRFKENLKYSVVICQGDDVHQTKKYIALNVDAACNLIISIMDNKPIWTELKSFIDLIEKNRRFKNPSYVVLDKNELTLMTTFSNVGNIADKIDYWYKTEVVVEENLKSNDVLGMLDSIKKLKISRLVIKDLKQIHRLMKCNKLIEKMMKLEVSFLFKGIEIQPKLIQDEEEKSLTDEILKRVEKKQRLEMEYE